VVCDDNVAFLEIVTHYLLDCNLDRDDEQDRDCDADLDDGRDCDSEVEQSSDSDPDIEIDTDHPPVSEHDHDSEHGHDLDRNREPIPFDLETEVFVIRRGMRAYSIIDIPSTSIRQNHRCARDYFTRRKNKIIEHHDATPNVASVPSVHDPLAAS
jgi:hypothetical protein